MNYYEKGTMTSQENSMIRLSIFSGLFVVGLLGPAMAQAQSCPCSGAQRLTNAQIVTALGNKTICAALGSDSWQEFHTGASAAGGDLVDYKRGPGHPVDPTERVGSWSVTGNTNADAEVRYAYTGGTVYSYAVCTASAGTVASGPYAFCGQGLAPNVTNVTTRSGLGSCLGANPASNAMPWSLRIAALKAR